MISILGRTLVLLGLLCATSGAVLGFMAGRNKTLEAWRQARFAAYGFSASMIAANLLMVYALVTHEFSVAYVAEVGSRSTPVYYTVISLWSSLNGSILFWGGVLGVYSGTLTWLYRDRYREYMPYTIGVLSAICVFFALLVASIANPFAPVLPVPLDGPGPNPLLQNHWLMAYHPPTLYLGYVGMAVPFAMCSAALLAGRLEAGFMAPLRRWVLVPWTFLTLGILMGGWWSYEVLGWGGYWAWDPVENASFLPWLTGTAFLHSAMVMERKGLLKTWTLVLGLSTFLLTMLGTFMTRSGVFNSVHSFTQSDIGPVFLGFIAVAALFTIALLATREHLLEAPSESGGVTSEPTSREFAILLQNVVFTVFTFTVLFGVLYPLITEAAWSRKVSVGEPYFDRMALPLGLALVFLMGVGPALPWGRLRPGGLKRFLSPLISGGIGAGAAFVGGITHLHVLLAIGLCLFALIANGQEFLDPVIARMRAKEEHALRATREVLSRSHRRFGGHVAHLGVLMAVIAIAMSKTYKMERDFVLTAGQSATVGRYTAVYTGSRESNEPHRRAEIAHFDIQRNGKPVGSLEPRLNFYDRMREPIGTPAVHSRWDGDFYISLMQIENGGSRLSVRAMTMPLVPWLWVSGGVIAFGSLMVLWPTRRSKNVELPPVSVV